MIMFCMLVTLVAFTFVLAMIGAHVVLILRIALKRFRRK